ncbi:MAG: transglycosylase domain-containing protein [Oligoflexales bacterium]
MFGDQQQFFITKIKNNLNFYVIVGLVAFLSGMVGIGAVVAYQVFFGDTEELKKSTILARINEETIIFADDEETRFGSFFDSEHRKYVKIDDIPAHMIRAMVASEDKNFYQHVGIDPIAIADAVMDGVLSGFRFKRGASTITQQTVKNIMGRRERTFRRKFKEMIRALQIERMYSKQQILEFYLNQFHVTANGNGIGIASRYYFDKDVQDLTLVEGAFIAGSVKAPSRYNPFVKDSKEDRDRAVEEANGRKNYVLRRMFEQGWIGKEEFEQAFVEPIPFKKGKFRTNEVALVSLIRGQLDRPEVLSSLDFEDISELDHAGLKIFTTLNADLQTQAQHAMRINLSRLETILEGFKPEPAYKYRRLRSLDENQYFYGKIEKIVHKGGNPQIEIDFGLPKGIVPYESLLRTAKLLSIPTYEDPNLMLKELVKKFKVGDVVFVEVMEYDRDTHQAVLELRKAPKINGGMIAVDKGDVKAVVSGFEAKGFNRAMFATRQPGSVFKTVVFFASLQLGWTVLDRLDNERRVFPFQGKFYYPRPDHQSPYEQVSILWAGVKSENLASIFLTSHLLDKANFGQFKLLMGNLGLLPLEGESARDYHYRVAKATGVQVENEGIKEHLLSNAIEDVRPDLIFNRQAKLYNEISKMWWGRGYVAEMKAVYEAKEDEVSKKEKQIRIALLKNNYERMTSISKSLEYDWNRLKELVGEHGAEKVLTLQEGRDLLARFRVLSSVGKPQLAYVRTMPEEEVLFRPGGIPQAGFAALEAPVGRNLDPFDVQAIWSDSIFGGGLSIDEVKLGGVVPKKIFTQIQANLEQRFASIMQNEGTYNLYRYFNHHDFRIVLGLKYLVELSKAMGVYSPLEPVLSFPLGTNDVSVAEVAKIYQTFTEGKVYQFYEKGPANQLNFIKRIEDRNGTLLYEPKKIEKQLVNSCVASQVTEILRKVVTHGTGSRARGELYIPVDATKTDKGESVGGFKVRVEAFGKTGTTNDYTTSYFAGYVPYPTRHRAPLRVSDSYVIASYVGYDLNKTMKRGNYRISGAYGALPAWTDFAKSIITSEKYVDYLDKLDISLHSKQVWPMENDACSAKVKVDLPQGVMVGAPTEEEIEIFDYTNIEKEGETFVNEFARNANVQSYVSLAVGPAQSARQPLRTFKPVNFGEGSEKEYEDWSDPALDGDLDGGRGPQDISIDTPAPVKEEVVPERPVPEEEKAKDKEESAPEDAAQEQGASTEEKADKDKGGYVEEDLW